MKDVILLLSLRTQMPAQPNGNTDGHLSFVIVSIMVFPVVNQGGILRCSSGFRNYHNMKSVRYY
ncbi:hypothetical protein D3C75_1072570 [compost metagenome]